MNDVDRWIQLSRELEAAQAEVKRLSIERDLVMHRLLTATPRKTYRDIGNELGVSYERVGQVARRLWKQKVTR